MATIRIPRLVGKPNKSGFTNWYWQPSKTVRAQGWEPVELGRSPGGVADLPQAIADAARKRNADYAAWRGDDTPAEALAKAPPPRAPAAPRTLGQGIKAFEAAGWPSVKEPGTFLEPSTRRQYKSKFKVLNVWGGDVAIGSVTSQRVGVLREALMAPAAAGRRAGEVRRHHAHETLRVGRSLFAWFIQKGWLARGANPFENFGLAAPDSRSQIWWPPEREAILARAETEEDWSMALAIDLAFQIGQREGDLIRTGIGQYSEVPAYKIHAEIFAALAAMPVPAYGGRPGYVPGDVRGIRIRQGKTRRWIEVPIVGLTRARVEAAIAEAKAAGRTTLLFDQARGLPWTMPTVETGQTYFIRRFAELRAGAIADAIEAGDADLAAAIADLQYRDFRRTAVVHMGELGLEPQLVAAITGHDLDATTEILETYMPRTTGMAARAIAMTHERAPAAAKREERQR